MPIENFEPQPNTYYISGTIEKDIFTRAQYGDAYDGKSVSGMIYSGDNQKIYLAQSTTPQLPLYGSSDSQFSSLTLGYFTHNISTVRQFHTPLLKIYPVSPETELFEGQLDILPVESQGTTVFCSYLTDDNYLFKEEFNGTNMGYQDRDSYNKQIYMGATISEAGLWSINGQDLYDMISNLGYLKYGYLSKTRAATYFNENTNFGLVKKKSNGLWVVTKNSATFTMGDTSGVHISGEAPYVSQTGDMQFPIETWVSYGATQSDTFNTMVATQYDITDIDFVDRVTQFNSIFNFVRESPDAEDIKVQTVGETGDTTKFYTYSRVGLQSSDKLSGGGSAQFTNFWENYSGADSQYSPYFGTTAAGTALPQTCLASMDFLPRPFPFDMGSSGTASARNPGPAVGLEIELTLKFASMPPALLTSESYNSGLGPIVAFGGSIPYAGNVQGAYTDLTFPDDFSESLRGSSTGDRPILKVTIGPSTATCIVYGDGGSGYQVGSRFLISGGSIGGADGVNDITATVTEVTTSGDSQQMHLQRGFAIILAQDYPWNDEGFYDYLGRLKDNKRTATGLFFYSSYNKTSSNPKVYGIPFLNLVSGAVTSGSSLQTGADTGIFFISGGVNPHEAYGLNGNNNYFEFSENQWQDIVISYGMPNLNVQNNGTDGNNAEFAPKDWLMAYSPTAAISGGALQAVKLELGDQHFGSVNGWVDKNVNLNSMSMWCLNQRANASDHNDSSGNDLRNTYIDQQGFRDDDMTISVLLDSIGFKNANWKVGNASINDNNPHPSNVVIPPAPTLRPAHMISGNSRTDTYSNAGIPTTIDKTFWPVRNQYTQFGISGTVGNNDNYWTTKNTTTHSNICFGFDDLDSLLSPESGGGEINLLMNNYFTSDPNTVNGITSDYISGSYSSGTRIGISGQNFTGVTVNHTGAAGTISFHTSGAAGTGRVDDFTQKGFISVSGLQNISGSWAKRENIFASARIIGSNGDGSIIEVDNPSVFDMALGSGDNGGTDYVMYNFWKSRGVYESDVTADNAAGITEPLYQIKPRDGHTIYLNRPTEINDSRDDSLCTSKRGGIGIGAWTSSVNDRAFGSLFIGPKKHWLNLSICNVSGAVNPTGSAPSYAQQWGVWMNKDIAAATYPKALGLRSYTSVLPTSGAATGTTGSTFREWLYTDGVYANEWSLNNDNVGGVIETDVDYGYGTYIESTDDNSQVLGGYIQQTYPRASVFSFPKLDSYIEKSRITWNQPFNFSLYPFLENSGYNNYYGINISTKDGTYPPYLIWGLKDIPPTLSNLSVQGNTDILNVDNPFEITPNLLNTVKLTWDEEKSEDIWYRYGIIDKDPVYNKYHKASIYTHLNSGTATTQRAYINYASRHHKTTTGSQLLNASGGVGVTFEGLAGYATYYNGTSGTALMSPDNFTWMKDQNKGSMMVHVVPSAGSGTVVEFNRELTSNATGSAFQLAMSGNKVVANIYPMAIKASGLSMYSATSTVHLSSRSAFLCDGKEPINIALTFDGPASSANWKLYINGLLEDSQNYTTTGALEIGGNLYLGGKRYPASGGAKIDAIDNFTGRIEEFVTYNDVVLQFPTSKEYIYDTSSDLNYGYRNGSAILDTDERNSLNARLFAADYHNIRGTTPRQIGMSNQVGWRVSGI